MSSVVNVLIQAQDEASDVIEKIGGTADKSFNLLGKAAETAAGILMADMTRALGEVASQSLELGARFQGLNSGFEMLSKKFGDGALTLDDLRKATEGTVSDVDLLTAANRALAMGLPIGDFQTMYSAAERLASVYGYDVKDAINQVTMGMEFANNRYLKQLGVVVDVKAAEQTYAASIGVTVDKLTDEEKTTAFQTEAMKQLKTAADQVTDANTSQISSMERMGSSFDNLKTSIGSLVSGPLTFLMDAWSGIFDVLDGRQKAWWQVADSASSATKSIAKSTEEVTETTQQWMDESIAATGQLADGYSEANMRIQQSMDSTQAKLQQVMNAANAELVKSYEAQYDTTIKSVDDIEGVISGHYDKLLSDSASKYSELEAQTNKFYSDQVSAAYAGVQAVKDAEEGKLNALEETYLKQKVALEDSLAAGIISQSDYDTQVKALDSQYYKDRGTTSDHYRLQELQATDKFKDDSTTIEANRAKDIKAIEDQKKTDALKIQQEENTALSTFREAMLGITQNFATQMANMANSWTSIEKGAVDSVITEYGKLTAEYSDIESWRAKNPDLPLSSYPGAGNWEGSLATKTPTTGVTQSQGQTDTQTGTQTASSGGVVYSNAIAGGGYYSPTAGTYYKTQAAADAAEALAQARVAQGLTPLAGGFEGYFDRPTLALVGEAGSEHVTVRASNESSGRGGSLVFAPQITTGPIYGFAGADEFLDYLYDKFSQKVKREQRSKNGTWGV